MKRYWNAARCPLLLVALGVSWVLSEGQVWRIAAIVVSVLLLLVLFWQLRRGKERSIFSQQQEEEGLEEFRREYTWQYRVYRLLVFLSAGFYLVGGLLHLILPLCQVDNGWCFWVFVAGLALGAASLVLAVWDEAIDPADLG